MTRRIIILNSRPGLWRGGRPHPQKAAYDLACFTPEQLAEIEAEPAFATHVFDEMPPAEATAGAGAPADPGASAERHVSRRKGG